MNPLRALVLQLSRIPIALLLVIIVVIAGVIAMGVTSIITESQKTYEARKAELEQKANAKGKVVYTVHDIAEGQPIPSDALEEKEIEQSKIPQDAITSASLANGRIAKYGILAGQIVSQHDLAPQGISLGFESKLKEGMRAITFGIDNNSGVAGFVTPDSHVDVIAMVGAGADTKASAILSDVEVIAVGQLYQKSPGQSAAMPSSSVTVCVSPEDATKLIKAISASKLYLTLRNDKDHTPVATVDVTSMFGGGPGGGKDDLALQPPTSLPPPPLPGAPDMGGMPGAMNSAAPPPPALHEVEIWSGSKKDVVSVPGG
jgi:Flp pilus assembly protein CpaB